MPFLSKEMNKTEILNLDLVLVVELPFVISCTVTLNFHAQIFGSSQVDTIGQNFWL